MRPKKPDLVCCLSSSGWADKLAEAIAQLQAVYEDKEVILAGHSMGGLAGRGYITFRRPK